MGNGTTQNHIPILNWPWLDQRVTTGQVSSLKGILDGSICTKKIPTPERYGLDINPATDVRGYSSSNERQVPSPPLLENFTISLTKYPLRERLRGALSQRMPPQDLYSTSLRRLRTCILGCVVCRRRARRQVFAHLHRQPHNHLIFCITGRRHHKSRLV